MIPQQKPTKYVYFKNVWLYCQSWIRTEIENRKQKLHRVRAHSWTFPGEHTTATGTIIRANVEIFLEQPFWLTSVYTGKSWRQSFSLLSSSREWCDISYTSNVQSKAYLPGCQLIEWEFFVLQACIPWMEIINTFSIGLRLPSAPALVL